MKGSKILEKKTQRFIDQLTAKGGPPLYKLSIREARKVLDTLQASPVEKLPVKMDDKLIPGDGKEKISIRIIRPVESVGKLPVVMYFHGGGWILGNKDTHDRLVREIAVGSNCAVVFVNYTPSPEAKFPIAIEQAYAATKYIAEHGKDFNLDSSRLAIFGDSVGGNMAAVVALLAKERGGPKIQTQVLFYPVTDANFNTPSYKELADGPWLTKAAMEWFWNAYEPDLAARKKHTVSPLHASIEQLKHLPPALIVTDDDVLRDEGQAYAFKLMQADVEVTAVHYFGTIHDFAMLNALKDTPAARSAIALATTHLQKVFKEQKAVKHKKAA